jgi:hypothetical protein
MLKIKNIKIPTLWSEATVKDWLVYISGKDAAEYYLQGFDVDIEAKKAISEARQLLLEPPIIQDLHKYDLNVSKTEWGKWEEWQLKCKGLNDYEAATVFIEMFCDKHIKDYKIENRIFAIVEAKKDIENFLSKYTELNETTDPPNPKLSVFGFFGVALQLTNKDLLKVDEYLKRPVGEIYTLLLYLKREHEEISKNTK